jgi:D-alanyl-D-alanine carboxypeptidase (penicillin-binding protein 5/6)
MRGTPARAACVATALLTLISQAAGAAPVAKTAPAAKATPRVTVGGPPKLTAKSAILVDAASGQVLWERAADQVREPASLTKMMTALLAFEQGRPDDLVVVSPRAAATGEASAHLEPGDRVTLHDLLLAVLLPSGNDASVAVAEHVGGSLDAFVARMNARAQALGLTATHFVNPNGLPDPRHVSSARDLARLACAALKLPAFRETVALPEAEITLQPAEAKKPPRKQKLENHNRLLLPKGGHYWELADGVKTGYTREAGRCLAASATKDGWQLVCVVLGCTDSWTDARQLLGWGFADFQRVRLVTQGQTTARAHVIDGSPPVVTAVAGSSIDVVLSRHGGPPTVRVSESFPTAPVAAGAEVGELVVSGRGGTELRASLVTPVLVSRSLLARVHDHLGEVIAGIVALSLIGAWLIYGAVTKAAGVRRERFAARVRGDDQGRTSDGGRGPGPSPGPDG